MTRRAKKVCATPGCPTLVDSGVAKCDTCTGDAEQVRGTAAERGYDHRWRVFRADFLLEHPFCSEDFCLALATDVDHIDGLGPLGPRGFDPENCQGFCHPHHSRKTARENGSFGRWA